MWPNRCRNDGCVSNNYARCGFSWAFCGRVLVCTVPPFAVTVDCELTNWRRSIQSGAADTAIVGSKRWLGGVVAVGGVVLRVVNRLVRWFGCAGISHANVQDRCRMDMLNMCFVGVMCLIMSKLLRRWARWWWAKWMMMDFVCIGCFCFCCHLLRCNCTSRPMWWFTYVGFSVDTENAIKVYAAKSNGICLISIPFIFL